MHLRSSFAAGLLALAAMTAAACSNPLGPQYEYEEQIYLEVDGGAELVIDSSIAALIALRGLPLDPSPDTPVDRELLARQFADPDCGEVTVNRPWMRHGRRFAQIRLEQDDVRKFAGCGPVSWSTFVMEHIDDGPRPVIRYEQRLGAPTPGTPGEFGWDGSELVGFKLHLPSRILFHNVKRLEDGSNGEAGRGNILTWEQRLADRRAGTPIVMEVRMDGQSILNRTLWLFAAAFGAAVIVLSTAVWWVIRRARKSQLNAARA